MRKFVKFLLPILVISSMNITSCKNKEDAKVLLSFGDVHSEGCKKIDALELNQIVLRQESFILVINSETCGCWSEFKPNLTKYVVENKLLCYQLPSSEFFGSPEYTKDLGLTKVSPSSTTLAIFENGKHKKSINTNDNSELMYDFNNFSKYMERNVVLPKCFLIRKDDVSIIKNSDKNAIVYFERSGCGDCSALNPTILYSYIKNHQNMNNIFVLDCQPYYKSPGSDDYDSYIAFKDEMGLSTINNPVYGYNAGVFPFFSYIENGEYKSGCVVYNDEYEEQDGKVIITDSYYTTERIEHLDYTTTVLKGMELPNDQLQIGATRKIWSRDGQNKTYEKILASFLDAKLPLVSYNF